MKILVLSFYYYPDLCAGSFRCTALVEQLKREANVTIDIITTRPNRYASYTADAPEFEAQEGVTIRRIALPSHASGMVDQAKAFIYFIKHVIKLTKQENYDLVFATSSRLMTAVLGAWVATRQNSPLYLDIRDIFVDTIKDVLPAKLSRWAGPFFSLVERWTFRQASRINLVSKGFQSYFETRYPHKRLSWFTNGVDDEFLLPVENGGAVASSDRLVRVVYAGNVGEGQGLHRILPELAMRMRERLYFRVIGDGGRMNELALQLKLLGCPNVELLKPMPREQLIREYQQADVLFFHLNQFDAFHKVLPSKVFEYAAMGKPVWAGVAGFSAEFIDAEVSNATVFKPCDVADAERAFNQLQLVTRPREAFVEKYARRTIMEAMASDIVTLAKGKSLLVES